MEYLQGFLVRIRHDNDLFDRRCVLENRANLRIFDKLEFSSTYCALHNVRILKMGVEKETSLGFYSSDQPAITQAS